jgi:DNA polymerase
MPAKASIYPSLEIAERRQWVNAFIQVMDFRDKNPSIIKAWKALDRLLKEAARDGEDFEVESPSGRMLQYFRCRNETDGVTCATQRGKIFRTKTYGANIFQNMIQSIARDCFAFQMNRIADAGYRIVLHVHDEVVVEVDEDSAEESKKEIIKLMSTGPKWMGNVPLDAEAIITKEYTK